MLHHASPPELSDHVVSAAISVVTGAGSSRAGAIAAEILQFMDGRRRRLCEHEGCSTIPTFAEERAVHAQFCKEHKTDDMVDVINKRCAGFHDGVQCKCQPAFDYVGGSGRFCAKHKLTGMENVKSKRCEGRNEDDSPCTRVTPAFDYPGGKGRFCSTHQLDGMEDVKHKRCVGQTDGVRCKLQPAFDYAGGKGQFCAKHKLTGMENVKSNRCEGINEDGTACVCVSPIYNFPGCKGRFCATHKLDGMENVKSKRCEGFHEDGTPCTHRPSFDHPGGKGRFCATHKEGGMENVKSKRCAGHNGDGTQCSRQPIFDFPGGKGSFCAAHKQKGMENVKDKRCEGFHEDGTPCTRITPCFDYPGGKGRFCVAHKEDGMENVKAKCCEGKQDDGTPCTRMNPLYNYAGGKGTFCVVHKLDGMVDVKHPCCATPFCETRASRKHYDGYCLRCFMHLFPDKPVAKNYRIKEKHVTDYIKTVLAQDFPHLQAVYDKTVDGGCSRRRPDVLIDCGTHSIIIEVDENQHDTEEYCSCENKRVMELFEDLGSRPLVMLRFNPDDYTDASGNKVPSCFARHSKLEVTHVSKTQKKQWDSRLETLRRAMVQHATTVPDQEVTWEHLYYDGFYTSV